jgi:hypothetical protein
MKHVSGNSVRHESQDERLKFLAKILSPGAALILLPLLSKKDLLSFSGALDLLIAALGALFIVSAFLARYSLIVLPDERVLEVRGRLLGWQFSKKRHDLATICHVQLAWDDQPPFLTVLTKRLGIHPVTLLLSGGKKELILQSKSIEYARNFADLIRSLSDLAKNTAPEK